MKKCFSLFLSTIFIFQFLITANAKTVTKENEDVVATFNTTTTSEEKSKQNLPIEITYPSKEELEVNSRSKSAKLRVFEKRS